MTNKFPFSEREKIKLVSFLNENLVGAEPRPQEFAELLIKAAESDSEFHTVLRKWFNGATDYSDADIVVNGYSLMWLADFYVFRKLGILVALRLLWQEKNGLTDICLTIGASCFADKVMMSRHERVDLAYLGEEGWTFYGENFDSDEQRELGAFELYRVCENDPPLIELVISSDDLPVDGCFVCRTDENNFHVFIDKNASENT